LVGAHLGDIKNNGSSDKIASFVIYNLPGRDCISSYTYGKLPLSDDGERQYVEFIDSIMKAISHYPKIPVVLIIEPDAVANIITHADTPRCASAATTHRTMILYAIKKLALQNVAIYLDGGNSGSLGWPDYVGSAATLFASIYAGALAPRQLRGVGIPFAPRPQG
jgi:cellulose 1,4-beta-cellobiosidase